MHIFLVSAQLLDIHLHSFLNKAVVMIGNICLLVFEYIPFLYIFWVFYTA